MVPGDAVEKDRLASRVGQEVRRLGHLLDRGGRAPHRYQNPVDSGRSHRFRLINIFKIIFVDCRQGDDRLDPLPVDDPAQGTRALPGSSYQRSLGHHRNPLFEKFMALGDQPECQRQGQNNQTGPGTPTSLRHQEPPPLAHSKAQTPELKAQDCNGLDSLRKPDRSIKQSGLIREVKGWAGFDRLGEAKVKISFRGGLATSGSPHNEMPA